ncbi:MAG: DNA (cytosine-5-)-methyltransferase [Proteobacteria bacterium]|nr:MAG: DNA (cytosine-5-)-methyltransferase [Pseudomonadota bacterium]
MAKQLDPKAPGKRRGRARSSKTPAAPLLAWTHEQQYPDTPPQQNLAVAGLFAGVGGIELGLHRAKHRASLLCENETGAAAVLENRFPGIRLATDVRELKAVPSDVQLLAAGFPCQDLSQAGMTKGIDGHRSGLIGEVFRLLRRRRVPWLLLENVPFMLQLARGRALEVIVSELEELGYRWAYRVVDSRAFGVPQRRERVFLIASLDHDPRAILFKDDVGPPQERPFDRNLAFGFYWTEGVRGLGWAVDAVPTLKGGSTVGIPSPPAILLPSGEIVTPDLRDAERMQGFRPDWTRPAESVVRKSMRWKMVGNAVTVPVSEWIGRSLAKPGNYDGTWDPVLPKGSPWPRAAWNIGSGRHASSVSTWPERRTRSPLQEFLLHPTRPLSLRAAAGFRARTKLSSLRFPTGFLDAIDAHIERVRQIEPHGRQVSRRAQVSP